MKSNTLQDYSALLPWQVIFSLGTIADRSIIDRSSYNSCFELLNSVENRSFSVELF